jgi:hypothetical protein
LNLAERFRESTRASRRNEGWKDWDSPPRKYRLPIDCNIEELIQRATAPRVDRTRPDNFAALACFGPYKLAREHLECAAQSAFNPDTEELHAAQCEQITDRIDAAIGAINGILTVSAYEFAPNIANQEYQTQMERISTHFPRSGYRPNGLSYSHRAILGCQIDLEEAFRTLVRMRHLVQLERTTNRQYGQHIGRPRAFWRGDFIDRMAHLWRLLTNEEASRKEESLFGSFVHAAWISYDEKMPEVSFARAIRERPVTELR